MRYIEAITLFEFYYRNKKNATAAAEKHSAYFNTEAKCFAYVTSKKLEGELKSVLRMLNDTEDKIGECIYCPFNKRSLRNYMDKLD